MSMAKPEYALLMITGFPLPRCVSSAAHSVSTVFLTTGDSLFTDAFEKNLDM